MKNSIDRYLAELKKELSGLDRATTQDALADAEEYLHTALDNHAGESAITAEQAFREIMEKYGTPAEVAAAYRDLEVRQNRVYVPPADKEAETATAHLSPPDMRPWYLKLFGVFAEPRAWSALLYVILTLATGIIYFTWVVTGVSLSAGLLVLIIGIPVAVLFLLSVRGIALVEGRIVEALLGVRMPRRQLFTRRDLSLWQKLKSLLTQRQTWTTMIYMVLQYPLGVIYFSVVTSLIGASAWMIGRPVFELVFDWPLFINYNAHYYTQPWALVFWVIGGVLLLTGTMHLVKLIGKLHGSLAKAMLVRE